MEKFCTVNERLGTIVILACVVGEKTTTLSDPQRYCDFKLLKKVPH